MKKLIKSIVATILFVNFCNAQAIVNTFAKDKKIFVQYDNGKLKEIASNGDNSVVTFSTAKNFVIYQSVVKKSETKGQEGEESTDQISIHFFNLLSNKDTILFTTCFDGVGGTKPNYANSIM